MSKKTLFIISCVLVAGLSNSSESSAAGVFVAGIKAAAVGLKSLVIRGSTPVTPAEADDSEEDKNVLTYVLNVERKDPGAEKGYISPVATKVVKALKNLSAGSNSMRFCYLDLTEAPYSLDILDSTRDPDSAAQLPNGSRFVLFVENFVDGNKSLVVMTQNKQTDNTDISKKQQIQNLKYWLNKALGIELQKINGGFNKNLRSLDESFGAKSSTNQEVQISLTEKGERLRGNLKIGEVVCSFRSEIEILIYLTYAGLNISETKDTDLGESLKSLEVGTFELRIDNGKAQIGKKLSDESIKQEAVAGKAELTTLPGQVDEPEPEPVSGKISL